MSAANGHANDRVIELTVIPPSARPSISLQFSPQQIKELTATLEVPFDPRLIEWRVINTSKNGGSPRGQVIPYADQRAYIDRLNQLFTPAGWTRKYRVHTSANFERSKDQKTVAKVFVTCELSINGLGTHSATGEDWADSDNAGTAAEAQAFKRSCACFGLGRYLYYFDGIWVDLDDRKRPKKVPRLPPWAIPDGWRSGARPLSDSRRGFARSNSKNTVYSQQTQPDNEEKNNALVRQVEAMAEPLGKAIYRGLLRTIARAWKPSQIQDAALLEKVLDYMQAAERGLRRLDAALHVTSPEVLGSLLVSLNIASLDKVDNLKTLKKIVLEMEKIAALRTS